MFDFVNYGAAQIETLMLVILRLSGLFILAPVLSHQAIPKMVKAGLLLSLSVLLVTVIEMPPTLPVESLSVLAVMALKELMIGFIVGLVYQLMFFGVQVAGGIVGYQIGFAMVQAIDPNSGSQVPILSRFYVLLATLFFLAINGHHIVIKSIADSYQVIPPGMGSLSGDIGELILKYSAYIFVMGLKVAAPVMVTLFLTDMALGTVAKTMPTMNVFFVGFPLKIGIGLMIMAIALPVLSTVLNRTMGMLDQGVQAIYLSMGKA